MYKVDNAIIMAAGVSSRFAPLSLEKPKALTEVRGEILIERQIRQLLDAGIHDIYVITGYKAEQFDYLKSKMGIKIIHNAEYLTRNNHSSIYAAKDIIRNTYICSADNYFCENPFEQEVDECYYSAVYSEGNTSEWCMQTDAEGYITHVEIGGCNAWYMLGHAFWSEEFSKQFLHILEAEYYQEFTHNLFWENIFINHINILKMKIRKYPSNYINEFDSIDELREFDHSYFTNTRSAILRNIAQQLCGYEEEITKIEPIKSTNTIVSGIRFIFRGASYTYIYSDQSLRRYEI